MTTKMPRLVRRFALTALLVLLAALPLAAQAGDGTPAPASRTEGSSGVVALSAGSYSNCALKADGSVACWGQNLFGQAPAHVAGPFVSLAAGAAYHSCGLKPDGSVACWGNNNYGQAPANVPGPFVSVATGYFNTCAIRPNGSVVCWGAGSPGGDTDIPHWGQSIPPSGSFVSLSGGYGHMCGLKADGNVECWGYNAQGQSASQTGPFVSVAARNYGTCGVKLDGSVSCWGSSNGTPPPAGTYASIVGGANHYCGAKADGDVACWGFNSAGEAPASVAGPFVSVAAGFAHTCALTADGRVECWGDNGYGQSAVPEDLGRLSFGQIAAGNAHACELKRDGTVACWGNNDEGQATAPAGQFTQVVAGDSHSCAIGTDSKVTCWGRNGTANMTHASLSSGAWRQLAPAPNGAICALSAASDRAVCIRDIYSNGYNGFRFRNISHSRAYLGNYAGLCGVRLEGGGDGFCSSGFDAAHTEFAGPWQRLESGLNHQCGLKANGTIECWVDPAFADDHQLDNLPAPTDTFRTFSVGWNHACAIRDNGQLACWGSNLNGQADAPAGTYVQVAAGNTFTCAIRSDGERVCWGASPGNPASLSNLPDGEVGQPYSTQIAISGPSAPSGPVFVVMGGTLPPGLTLSSSGLLAGTPTSLGTYSFTVDAEGTGGFAASRSYSVTIAGDATPPVIDYILTASSIGSNGWYTGNVTVTWSVVDTESLAVVDAGCGIGFVDTLASDTAGATFSCTATSGGGTSSKTTTSLKRDATPPTITAVATTAPNANGWYSGNVTIHFTCSDATSGLDGACPADVVLSASGSSATPTIYDNAGNSATSNAVTVQIDTSAPNVSYVFAPPAPDGNNGWYRSNVVIDWTIGDAQSGIASSNGCVDGTLSTDTSGASWTCTATNNAGLQASVTTSTIKRDATPPTLNPTVPNPLLRGQSYSASPNAADALSGIAMSSCGALNTSTTGSKSTTCTATDNAGNSRTVPLNYTVSTTCVNDGYKGTQLNWCQNICENGLTGATLDTWIHRWVNRYRDLPYCRVTPPLQ